MANGNYGAPWQALLNTEATPVDTNRDATYDQLMGFQDSPNASPGEQFAHGLMSSLSRNSPQGRELTMEIAKQRLANMMAMQLMQQKLQLAKENPSYQVVHTAYGANLMVNPQDPSDVHNLDSVDDTNLMRDTYRAKEKADLNKLNYENSPEAQQLVKDTDQAKLGLIKAQTSAQNALANQRPVDAAATQRRGLTPAPWTSEDTSRAISDFYKLNGYNKDLDFSGAKAQELAPAAQAYAEQKRKEHDAQIQQVLGGNPRGGVQPSQQQIPDFSGILDPNTLGQ